ncbi:hypothetical protein N7486_001074 [Penicillium sp. IBT 16267x]|nr:hypothetical protein N7486_001074 [Penicillium sp. IBT 16267x]
MCSWHLDQVPHESSPQPVALAPAAQDNALLQVIRHYCAVIPPPPTDIQYETAEAVIAAMNGFAKPYGFAICTVSCSTWKGV